MMESKASVEIAERVIRAAEGASFSSLHRELRVAEQLLGNEEERLELLGAIAHDMRASLDASGSPSLRLQDNFEPHLHLLRHLSRPIRWVN